MDTSSLNPAQLDEVWRKEYRKMAYSVDRRNPAPDPTFPCSCYPRSTHPLKYPIHKSIPGRPALKSPKRTFCFLLLLPLLLLLLLVDLLCGTPNSGGQ